MWRMLFRFAILALALCPIAARAQPSVADVFIRCGPAPPAEPPRPWMFADEVAAYLNNNAPTLAIKGVQQTAKAVPTVEFTVSRPEAISAADWRAAWFEAVIHPSALPRTGIDARNLRLGRPLPPSPTDTTTTVSVEIPDSDIGWLPSRWEVAIMVCVDPNTGANPNLDDRRQIRGFGRVPLYISSLNLSAALGFGAFAGLYFILALTARTTHARQIELMRQPAEDGSQRPGWWFALKPTVISQDAFGVCSLSRFQVLLFTLVIAGVYAYVMVRTGALPNLSPTVLTLLGITLTGSTLARVTDGPVLETPNRLWLLGTGVLDSSPRQPRWQDLLAAEGEIDVTRVQALAFSVFAAAALVIYGTGDLENFRIPEQLNYLIGISQVVYVAGKALPREAAKRLNEEVRTIRDAEAKALADPTDAVAIKTFETARNGLGSSLSDVFGERFREARLRGLHPGDRAVA